MFDPFCKTHAHYPSKTQGRNFLAIDLWRAWLNQASMYVRVVYIRLEELCGSTTVSILPMER